MWLGAVREGFKEDVVLGLTTELERGRFLVGRIALAQEHRGDKVQMWIWHCYEQANASHEQAWQLVGAGQPQGLKFSWLRLGADHPWEALAGVRSSQWEGPNTGPSKLDPIQLSRVFIQTHQLLALIQQTLFAHCHLNMSVTRPWWVLGGCQEMERTLSLPSVW